VDFHDLAPGGEALRAESEAIDTEGKILQQVVALGSNLKGALKVVPLAEDYSTGRNPGALSIANLNPHLTALRLGRTLGTDT
jgi:hypothetical protein